MANWEAKTVEEVVKAIRREEYVLPVIQRRFVWTEDEITLLFNSLLKGYSFGSIIELEEDEDSEPLFAFRKFSANGEPCDSEIVAKLSRNQFFIIDGQQRLQSFYIGLCGSFNQKELYFDLYSDFQVSEYNFKFALPDKIKIFAPNSERGEREQGILKHQPIGKCFWYSVKNLYARLAEKNSDKVKAEILAENQILDENQRQHVGNNIGCFFTRIFLEKSVGISKVMVDFSKDKAENRQQLVELFQRLNTGGTALSNLDLVASRLKGFDYRMEKFLDEVIDENKDIGFGQDEIVKWLMILRDVPLSDVEDFTAEEADFAIKNSARIKSTLKALKKFLERTGDYNWFTDKTRSAIPLYILAYHIFYSGEHDSDFADMKRWLKVSLLNGIFKRGCGWDPSSTGIKLLHKELQKHRGQNFPAEELFELCRKKLRDFRAEVTDKNLNEFSRNKDYLFYLIYDGKIPSRRAEDHVHSRSKLADEIAKGRKKFSEEDIDSIANLALITSGENQEKRNKSLSDWIKSLNDEERQEYLERHLIPEESRYWLTSNFNQFLKARAKLIAEKINRALDKNNS